MKRKEFLKKVAADVEDMTISILTKGGDFCLFTVDEKTVFEIVKIIDKKTRISEKLEKKS